MKVPTPFTSRADHVEHLARIMRDRAYPEFAAAPPPLWATDAADAILREFESLYRAAAPQGDERLREAAARAADFLDHLAEYEQRHLSHVECGGEPGLHDPLIVEASRLRSALDREAGR